MKRTLSLVLALFMLISIVSPLTVSASQNENARYGERVVYTVVDDDVKVVTRKVSDQRPEGTSISSEDGQTGGVIINPEGGSPVNLSLSVGWGYVSVSVTPGSLNSSGSVLGYYVPFPKNDTYYHVYGDHTYLIERLYVEEYRGVELISSYYLNRVTLTKSRWYAVEVS